MSILAALLSRSSSLSFRSSSISCSSSRNRCLTSIKQRPSRFRPHNSLFPSASLAVSPMPQVRSRGLASTSSRSPVASSAARKVRARVTRVFAESDSLHSLSTVPAGYPRRAFLGPVSAVSSGGEAELVVEVVEEEEEEEEEEDSGDVNFQ